LPLGIIDQREKNEFFKGLARTNPRRLINSITKSDGWPVLGVGGLVEKPFMLMNPFPHDKVYPDELGDGANHQMSCENVEPEYTIIIALRC
jgi:hypothetical protein